LSKFWFHESHTPGYEVKWRINSILHSEQTKYQKLSVVETEEWGRALILDDALQTTEKDEFIYHEMIVHPAMNTHPNPENVLIIGGGDGGTLREVARYKRVKTIHMVEIDERVIENSKKYFPSLACAFNDPRLTLLVKDGVKYVRNTRHKYDIVIVDSSDPVGPAVQLFSREFYQDIYNILDDAGLLVVQSESPIFYQDIFKFVNKNISEVFPNTYVYLAAVPTYVSGPWSFTMGSKKYDPLKLGSDRTEFSGLKYYSNYIHTSAFYLPFFIREMLK